MVLMRNVSLNVFLQLHSKSDKHSPSCGCIKVSDAKAEKACERALLSRGSQTNQEKEKLSFRGYRLTKYVFFFKIE